MRRPRLLDLFCGAGGCAVGYDRAGFDVTGVDITAHPDYPYRMLVADAITILADVDYCQSFDVLHASPPCPRYSSVTPAAARANHPDLVGPTRAALHAIGRPYVIENVPGAPLVSPLVVCGSSFGLRVRRHRLFESSVWLMALGCSHPAGPPVGVYGHHDGGNKPGGWRRPSDGTARGVKARDVADAGDALGIDWMSRWDDLTDAIPPAYTEFVGGQVLAQLAAVR